MTAPSPAPHPADRYTLLAAGVVILALTAAGFWLSYAHLAEVAGDHGLGNSPARMWAWPATLDAFIVAGELLMLRAGLRRRPDGWAIAITATGSLGSIALNVAGVTGTRDPRDSFTGISDCALCRAAHAAKSRHDMPRWTPAPGRRAATKPPASSQDRTAASPVTDSERGRYRISRFGSSRSTGAREPVR